MSFIASHDCNTGHILDLEKKVDPVLNQLINAVADT
jgi:mitogen-activated protein kinase kinase 1 interacting protein 1